jgi:Flp pilus assembly protein TadD
MKRAPRNCVPLLAVLAAVFAGPLAGWAASPAPATPERPAGEGDDAAYRFLLAQTLAQEGEYREALTLFEELVRDQPEEPYVRVEYAELLFRLGRIRRAEEEAAKARELAPEDKETVRLYGQINLRLAEDDPQALERAQAAFEQLRAMDEDVEATVTLGQIYLSRNRPEDAARLFAELLDSHPSDRMFVSFLLESLQRLGRESEAEEALVRFLDIDPEFLRARLGLAEIRSERGDHAGAVEVLQGAVEQGEEDAELLRQLAVELYRSGASEEALERLSGVLEKSPDDFGARYLRSLALVDLGRLEEAQAALAALVEESPENFDLANLLARVMEHEGQIDQAAGVLEQATQRLEAAERVSAAAEAKVKLAELLARDQRWPEVHEVTAALFATAEGRVLDVALLEAESLSQLGEPESALEVLLAISDGEDGPPPRAAAKRAEILFGIDRSDEARLALAPLAHSGDVDSLLLAADVLQRSERYGEAVPVLDQALTLEPNSLQILFRLGASLEREGRRSEAETRFRTLLSIQPDFAPALNYLGYMWAEKGENLTEALDLVRRAVALEPENGAYIDSLGWAYFQLGHLQEARRNLERAAELIPDDAVICEHLGDVYVAVGDIESAQEVYQRALSLSTENGEKVLDKLRQLAPEL